MTGRVSRRSFVALGLGAAGAAAAAGAVVAAEQPVVGRVTRGPRRPVIDTRALEEHSEFDYVVVGSGAGGGTVAVRLAEAGFRVLVVEAGPAKTDSDVYSVPAFHLFASSDPEMSWDFYVRHYTDRDRHSSAFVKKRDGVLYPRASTLGGCTAHHALLMLAPESDDWDAIGRLTGDPSWNALTMEKYERRVREWLPVETSPASLLAQDPVLARIVTAAVADTAGSAPVATKLDLNRGVATGTLFDPNERANIEAYRTGATLVPQSSRDGHRYGTRERLLEAAPRLEGNLFFQTDTLVERLVFDEPMRDGASEADADAAGSAGRRVQALDVLVSPGAYGASPESSPLSKRVRSKRRRRITVTREVIVAGGAFNTPQILMLSGVGPRRHLAEHGIDTVIDLPGVGGNLQDRYEMTVVTKFDRPFSILQGKTFGEPGDPGLAEWRSGDPNALYRSNGLLIGLKEKVEGGSAHPELFLFGAPSNFTGYRPGFAAEGLSGGDHFTWAIVRGYQSSQTGTVRLRSGDPTEPPLINFGYFNDGRGGPSSDQDLSAVREGIRRARSINDTARRLRFTDAATDRETFPGAGVATDAELDAAIERDSWGHHASCTAPMGRHDDPSAVLDSRFRLRGAANVRVVDASAFPKIPALFPLMTIFAMAERAASEIIADSVRDERTTS